VETPAARRHSGSILPPRVSIPHSVSDLRERFETAHALKGEEVSRIATFCRVIMMLSGVGLAVLPLFHDARFLFWPMVITEITLFGSSLWMWRSTQRRGVALNKTLARAYIGVVAVCGLFVAYNLGVFSPAPTFIILGIAFLAPSGDRSFAIGMPIGSAAAYFILALLVSVGALPDAGLFSVMSAQPAARALMIILVPVAFLVAFWEARQNRRATLRAIEESQAALRRALTREAQLDEARRELNVVLRAGAGTRGRYTGAMMGNYRLAEIVGRGAMGEIYAATDERSDQRAAVKVLQASVSENPALVERFYREGRIAAQIRSPHIVTVFDVGQGEEAVPFIAMELLEGEDLSSYLRSRDRLDLSEVVDLIEQVAQGLAVAHAAGVVHRDLKPQNIFLADGGLERRPAWKILDFGVSKLTDDRTLTQDAVIGTPGYMAPEQAAGGEVDARSDVFALGAVAYRALTGRPAFRGEMPQVLLDIAYRNPSRPSEHVPALPSDVDRVLAIALAKNPRDRFESAVELAAALRDASKYALDPAIRARGAKLLFAHPWGSTAPGSTPA
jgi:serine/threonine-protein kinase